MGPPWVKSTIFKKNKNKNKNGTFITKVKVKEYYVNVIYVQDLEIYTVYCRIVPSSFIGKIHTIYHFYETTWSTSV